MNTIRTTLGVPSASLWRTVVLRAAAIGTAIWGAKSSVEMAFGAKLMLTYCLDMWDFNESALGFFINYASIVGLYAALTHYVLKLINTGRARRTEDRRVWVNRHDR